MNAKNVVKISDYDQPAELPKGVKTFLLQDNDGEVLHKQGQGADSLAEVTPYIEQVSDIIANELGQEGVQNVHLLGRKIRTVVVFEEDRKVSAIYDATISPRKMAGILRDSNFNNL